MLFSFQRSRRHLLFLSLLARCLVLAMPAGGFAAEAISGSGESNAAAAADIAFRPEGTRLGERALTLPLLLAGRHIATPVVLYNVHGETEYVTLELCLDDPGVITLHADQDDWLQIARPQGGGEGAPVGLSFGGDGEMTIVPRRDVQAADDARAELQMSLTNKHAASLQERKIKGRIGVGFLQRFQVELDLPARKLHLRPLDDSSSQPVAGSVVTKFELSGGVIALPLQSGDAGPVVLGSSEPESRIAPEFVAQRGSLEDASASLVLRSTPEWNLARGFAFRPKAWPAFTKHRNYQPVAVTGTELLEVHRVVIDWDSQTIGFTSTRDHAADAGNRLFFVAESAASTDGLEAFLHQHPENHFAPEAADRLLELRFAEWGADDEDILRAARWRMELEAPDRRVETASPLVQRLAGMAGRSELALKIGRLGLEHSRGALDFASVYRLHRMMGIVCLELGDVDAAWRHLMSAASFQIEKDNQHAFESAYYLGQVYERQNRFPRAYSRYRAALAVRGVPSEIREQASTALARVREQIPGDKLKKLDLR